MRVAVEVLLEEGGLITVEEVEMVEEEEEGFKGGTITLRKMGITKMKKMKVVAEVLLEEGGLIKI